MSSKEELNCCREEEEEKEDIPWEGEKEAGPRDSESIFKKVKVCLQFFHFGPEFQTSLTDLSFTSRSDQD